MTIGIAAYGPNAGLAVFRALRTAEKIAWGAIGGFASFAVITQDGVLARFETQRGGTSTLFLDGELTGVEPPTLVREARIAAVISSGPDRPPPLAQFVAGDANAGLVTGHRLPNRPARSGVALNLEVLLRMRDGQPPRQAIMETLAVNPQADVGLIGVNLQGKVYGANSERAGKRPDLGQARREQQSPYAVVEVLHNAIYPVSPIAALAADMAIEVMNPQFHPDDWISLQIGTPVVLGENNAVLVDKELAVQQVITTDASLLHGAQEGAALYIGSDVVRDGELLGSTITEPYVILEEGVIRSLSGQDRIRIGFRRV
jgi:hypothetical protein